MVRLPGSTFAFNSILPSATLFDPTNPSTNLIFWLTRRAASGDWLGGGLAWRPPAVACSWFFNKSRMGGTLCPLSWRLADHAWGIFEGVNRVALDPRKPGLVYWAHVVLGIFSRSPAAAGVAWVRTVGSTCLSSSLLIHCGPDPGCALPQRTSFARLPRRGHTRIP